MSYILDALRKSERERQQADPLVLNPMGSDAIELPGRRVGLIGAVAAFAVIAIALSAYWIFVSNRVGPATVPKNLPASTEASKPPSGPKAALVEKTPLEAKAIRPAPELKPSPFVATRPRSSVRDLAKEARTTQPTPASSTPTTVVGTPSVPDQSSVQAKAPATTPVATEKESIKFLRAMPAVFQRELRDLSVTIHIYAPNEADRILYINNRQYRAGEQVRDGVVVEEIVPDGAVLTYRGQRFKLPRPT
jgi:general secretion pathway protein B